MKLAVIGQGYGALAVSTQTVEVGRDVVRLDLNIERVSALLAGRSYVEHILNGVQR